MTRWIVSRLSAGMVTMFVASFIIYSSLKLVPGDPLAALTSGVKLNPEQRAALREKLGLDQDLLSGFAQWLGGIAKFDFGQSLLYSTPVTDLVGARLPATAVLVSYSAILALVVGLGIAMVSATRPGILDQLGLIITSASIATPSFIVALVLLGVFAVQLRLFPATGSGSGFADMLYHLTLPAITLAIVTFGLLARVARTAFKKELRAEHVEVARSRGVPPWDIMRRHVVRNSLGPVVTLVALVLSYLFVGTAVVEIAFGVEGLGSLLVTSIARRDFPVVQAISLMAVALFVVTSTVTDLITPLIDPRVRTVGGLS